MMRKKRHNRTQSTPAKARRLNRIRRQVSQYLDSHDPFEWGDWEDELLDQENYETLVELRKGMVERQPDDARLYLHLADAYALNKDYRRGLEAATVAHRALPDLYECQELVLDLLFAQGHNEEHYDWIQKPSVVRLDDALLERCREYLSTMEHGCASTFDLVHDLFEGEYCCFDEEALARHLASDPTFKVERVGPGRPTGLGGWEETLILLASADGSQEPEEVPARDARGSSAGP